jgi:RNA polymerase sigma-70 factor, ECF subfamily
MLTAMESAISEKMTGMRADSDEWNAEWPQTAVEFETFISAFQDRMVRYAFRRLRDLQEAEDVAQEVFVKAYLRRNELRKVTRVAPYLYRMAANLCTDRHRLARPVIVPMEEMAADTLRDWRAGPQEQTAAAQSLIRADELLSRLPADQADVLRLRVLDELSLSEIAEVHGTSIATVKSRMRYGLEKLRRLVSSRKETHS